MNGLVAAHAGDGPEKLLAGGNMLGNEWGSGMAELLVGPTRLVWFGAADAPPLPLPSRAINHQDAGDDIWKQGVLSMNLTSKLNKASDKDGAGDASKATGRLQAMQRKVTPPRDHPRTPPRGHNRGNAIAAAVVAADQEAEEETSPSNLALAQRTFRSFAEADTDGDGQLSKDEFIAWYREQFNREPNKAEWEQFKKADKDGDGSISLVEAAAAAETYSCDFKCGFTGGFSAVHTHELSCNARPGAAISEEQSHMARGGEARSARPERPERGVAPELSALANVQSDVSDIL
jgi:hypothetical protein